MDMDEYQAAAGETAIYPGRQSADGIAYVTLGLTGEAGEIANKVKKILRDDDGELTNVRRIELFAELGDVLWYVAMLADELGADLSSVASANLEKLKMRQRDKKLHGEGDNR